MPEIVSLPQQVLDRLRGAEHIAILTGAGVSAESGIPTFRDKLVGLWENFDPAELATPDAFQRDPALVWGWYEWRRAKVLCAQPNAAHRSIAKMAKLVPKLTLITQNVDDLHERAGSREVLHLHGELAKPYCERCRGPYTLPSGIPEIPPQGQRIEPPTCPRCGSRIRPGVVWFGEGLPVRPWQSAVNAVQSCDVFLSIGTSAIVQPAASLIGMAARARSFTIQINPNPTEADDMVSFSLEGAAGRVMPALLEAAWGVAPCKEPAAREPEVIFKVLAEGGSVTLLGQRDSHGDWRYACTVNDGTIALLDEEEGGAEAIEPKTEWIDTWAEAMALLDRYPWTMLHCREVHPEFRRQVWTEVMSRLKDRRGVRADRALKCWMHACGIAVPEL
jgi:NAD-dependent deacetylase